MSVLVVGNCPICSGPIGLEYICTKDTTDVLIDEANENVFYKGAGYVLAGSVSALCELYNIPFGTEIGELTKQGVQMASAEIARTLNDMPTKLHFFEIRCKDCHFILKRYYTQNIY